MKLISWNVNGLRACVNKGFAEFLRSSEADIFCVQETKMQREQAEFVFAGYEEYWNSAVKKGYSGTAIFTKIKPLTVTYDLGLAEHDQEGRVITAEFANFYLVNVYTPNSQRELARLAYRMEWEEAFQSYVQGLNTKKPVIICGDLNVAAEEIDLKNPKTNHKNAGFSDEERGKFRDFLAKGFVDAFRFLYPEEVKYSWWSYMFKAREKNVGWRIDYFLVAKALAGNIVDSGIHNEIVGSDHCPVSLVLKD
ncbi:MAG: exodeoxyribonuclease III [Acidaminococcaceae bacterium]